MPCNSLYSQPGLPPEPTDERLVALAQKGDAAAFSELARRHRMGVRGVALRFGMRLEDADDIAQETWLSVHIHLSRFRGECSFRAWVWRIAQSKSLQHLRRARTSAIDLAEAGLDGIGLLAEVLPSRSKTPETLASERELFSFATAAVQSLKPRYRRPLCLWANENLDLTEIAQETGVSYSAAKITLYRARLAVRKRLQQRERIGFGRARLLAAMGVAVSNCDGPTSSLRQLRRHLPNSAH